MAQVPQLVADFLRGKRIVVAGVSRGTESAANPVYRKARDRGYEVFPVDPSASQLEGVTCYPDLASIPGDLMASSLRRNRMWRWRSRGKRWRAGFLAYGCRRASHLISVLDPP